jgi:hypothetical protein
MTDNDTRQKYIEEIAGTVDRHRERAFEYETKALDFAHNAFRTLTYLNGGALVAIPTAVALFKADITQGKFYLTFAAALFVAGLLLVVLAQAAAFFTMGRRSESKLSFQYEQTALANLRHYITDPKERDTGISQARSYNSTANAKIGASNKWRLSGLIFFWSSVGAFIVGCYFGARAILG